MGFLHFFDSVRVAFRTIFSISINSKMWKLLNDGEITLEEVLIKRFKVFLNSIKLLKIQKNSKNWSQKAFKNLVILSYGVNEILKQLYGKYELVIASNGPVEEQKSRMDNASL